MKSLKTLIKKVGRLPKNYTTPGTSGVSLLKAQENEEPVMHKEYISLVEKLMYLTTKILPEMSNAVRELKRNMPKPNNEDWKALEGTVGYLKYKGQELKFTYRKPKEMRVISCVDSNYAANQDDRRSVSGMFITVGSCSTSWASKTQNAVTLSSTEAEYIALTTCAQKVTSTLR